MIQIPPEWQPVDDYSSHRPLLYAALLNTDGIVLELGSGMGSTPLLLDYCNKNNRVFYSYDSNEEWARKTNSIWLPTWDLDTWRIGCGLCFIDMAPGEWRADALMIMKNRASVIVIHDTEEYAQRVYGIVEALKCFKYQHALHIPAHPSTSALSDYIDVSQWIIRL